MSHVVEKSAEWIYRGIWRILVEWFRVPDKPPMLPSAMRGELRVFHPSRRFLTYLKVVFWLALVLVDAAILAGWMVLYWQSAFWAWALALPTLVLAIVPDIIAYIALHLMYDTIWYAVSERGVHLRRGIWVITEHTISIANIQNVSITRDPLEQILGIATLVVETAGASAAEDANSLSVGNRVIMIGLDNANEIRELLMSKVGASRSSGLGDPSEGRRTVQWNATDLALLREIRDEVAAGHLS